MRKIKILALLLALLTLAGCWDSQELDSLSIVAGMGIDSAQKPEEAEFVFQVVKIQPEKEGSQNTAFLLDSTSEGVLPALRDMSRKSTRSLFLHQTQVIVVGKEQAKKGILPFLDSLLRLPEMRAETWMMVADDSAKALLSTEPEQEAYASLGLVRMMSEEYEVSHSLTTRMLDFCIGALRPDSACVTPIVRAEEKDDITTYALAGLAVFKNSAMVGSLDLSQKNGFYWTMGDLSEAILTLRTPQGFAALNVMDVSHSLSPQFTEDGRPSVRVTLAGYLSAGELRGFESLSPDEMAALIEGEASAAVRADMTDCFEASQQLKADIYGFGQAFERRYPDRWEAMAGEWDTLYGRLDLDLDVTLKLRHTGQITKPFTREVEDRHGD